MDRPCGQRCGPRQWRGLGGQSGRTLRTMALLQADPAGGALSRRPSCTSSAKSSPLRCGCPASALACAEGSMLHPSASCILGTDMALTAYYPRAITSMAVIKRLSQQRTKLVSSLAQASGAQAFDIQDDFRSTQPAIDWKMLCNRLRRDPEQLLVPLAYRAPHPTIRYLYYTTIRFIRQCVSAHFHHAFSKDIYTFKLK